MESHRVPDREFNTVERPWAFCARESRCRDNPSRLFLYPGSARKLSVTSLPSPLCEFAALNGECLSTQNARLFGRSRRLPVTVKRAASTRNLAAIVFEAVPSRQLPSCHHAPPRRFSTAVPQHGFFCRLHSSRCCRQCTMHRRVGSPAIQACAIRSSDTRRGTTLRRKIVVPVRTPVDSHLTQNSFQFLV